MDNYNDYAADLNRKETLRMINNRVAEGTIQRVRIKDSEIEVDVSAAIDHGRDSFEDDKKHGGVRSSSITD